MKKVLGVIPSRYESTRFPGKPLVDIAGKSMIQRVYEQCAKANRLTKIVVATDDKRIYDHVLDFGGDAMITMDTHQSGTERCGEVVEKFEDKDEFFDIVVNIQGDEPFISPNHINKVVEILWKDDQAEIGTLAKKITTKEELFNENVVKLVMTENEGDGEPRDALYFSRHPIPFVRGVEENKWLDKADFYKHIGIYAFNMDDFHEIIQIEYAMLEKAESLENLRWLSHHFTIQVAEIEEDITGIDTPEDLEKVMKDLN
ncbi:3-deoxy-manno-octulosonate cytidylyltransferase [Flavobacteriales bacterium]|nr:3-deoxy-manno-octulosonate cytidylyltransferase [Flavobacteriales bacterium]MDB9701849.1 3-deoxy-manno-octulosonate cytidylyltransferase [Flavobacteriales bacterium]